MNAIFQPTAQSALLGTAAWQSRDGMPLHDYRSGDVWLGRLPDGKAVGFSDDRHVFITGGTRGQKGVSYVIPNLVVWPGSVVAIDPKGENATVTARRRGHGSQYCEGLGQTVRVLDPYGVAGTAEDDLNDYRASFNPLDMVDPRRPETMEVATEIADSVIEKETPGEPFWNITARMIKKWVILHVASSWDFQNHERNLNTVRNLVIAGDVEAHRVLEGALGKGEVPSPFALLIKAMRRNPAFGGEIARGAESLSDLYSSPKTFVGVMSVLRSNLDFLSNPQMQACVARSDFKLSDLKTNPDGVSIYICVPLRHQDTHANFVRMMVSLITSEMERVRRRPASGHQVMMMLDEFAALRRMRNIENAAAQMAGFGLKFVFIAQTLAQIKDLYKDNWETLLANSGVKIFFGNDDHFTREYASKLIGEREIVRTVRSLSESSGTSQSRSSSASHTASESRTSGFSTTGQPNSITFSGSTTFGSSATYSGSTTEGTSQSWTRGQAETLHKRLLVTPDEIGRLFGNRDYWTALVLVSGYQPISINRTPYFRDEFLLGKFDPHWDHAPPLTLTHLSLKRDAEARSEMMRLWKAEAERKQLEQQREARRQQEFETAENERRERERRAWLAEQEYQREKWPRALNSFNYYVGGSVVLVWALLAFGWIMK